MSARATHLITNKGKRLPRTMNTRKMAASIPTTHDLERTSRLLRLPCCSNKHLAAPSSSRSSRTGLFRPRLTPPLVGRAIGVEANGSAASESPRGHFESHVPSGFMILACYGLSRTMSSLERWLHRSTVVSIFEAWIWRETEWAFWKSPRIDGPCSGSLRQVEPRRGAFLSFGLVQMRNIPPEVFPARCFNMKDRAGRQRLPAIRDPSCLASLRSHHRMPPAGSHCSIDYHAVIAKALRNLQS